MNIPHCRLCPVRSVDLTCRCVSLCNPKWSNSRPCLLVDLRQALPFKADGTHCERGKKKGVACGSWLIDGAKIPTYFRLPSAPLSE